MKGQSYKQSILFGTISCSLAVYADQRRASYVFILCAKPPLMVRPVSTHEGIGVYTPTAGAPTYQGGCPGPKSTLLLLCSGGFSNLLDASFSYVALISHFSRCNHDMWASLGYFLITTCRNRYSPKLMEIY